MGFHSASEHVLWRMTTYQKLLAAALLLTGLNLTLISLVMIDTVPNALAGSPSAWQRYGLVPLNPDGSITVSLSPPYNNVMDVNIKSIAGSSMNSAFLSSGPIPVKVTNKIEVLK